MERTTSPVCTQSFSGTSTGWGSQPELNHSMKDLSTCCWPCGLGRAAAGRRRTCRPCAGRGRASRRRSSRGRTGAARPGPWGRRGWSAGPRTSAAAAARVLAAQPQRLLGDLVDVRATRRRGASRSTRSRCPGSRRCCCRAACGRARRRAVSIGTPLREAAAWPAGWRPCARRTATIAGSSVSPLDAVVPGAVVVGAVAVVLAVGLVVLVARR